MKIGFWVALSWIIGQTSPALSASELQKTSDPFFDCAQARTKVQKTICSDPGLLQWDDSLFNSYNRLLARVSGDERRRAVEEQTAWLRQREFRCTHAPPNPGFPNADPTPQCITEMFSGRSSALEEAYSKAVCRNPDRPIMDKCEYVETADLPEELRNLMENPYDLGGAFSVDLNDDGSPEMLVCSRSPSHGPCSAFIAGKTNSAWKSLSAERVRGFSPPCENFFIVLENMTNGYHDICFIEEQTPIWKFLKGKYRPASNSKKE